jgi:hypothetical protein
MVNARGVTFKEAVESASTPLRLVGSHEKERFDPDRSHRQLIIHLSQASHEWPSFGDRSRAYASSPRQANEFDAKLF